MSDPTPAVRITVFLPAEHLDGFVKAVQDDIPSFLGPYDRVMWWSEPKIEHGTEQFRPLNRSIPKEGQIGETVQKPSVRIEFLIPDDQDVINSIIEKTIKPAHPFNDPVIYYDRISVA